MMTKSRGRVWHKKYKQHGVVPPRLRNIDREATWGFSNTVGWVYGHGTFCVTAHKLPVLGLFRWMENAAHEGKQLEMEVSPYTGLVKRVFMDSRADDQQLYFDLKEKHHIQLVTRPRKGLDKSPRRKLMIAQMCTRQNLKDYRQRAVTVEPMQGLMKAVFDLQSCWMHGSRSNRWLFAAMGVAVQIAQLAAYRSGQSTWNIKQAVLGT